NWRNPRCRTTRRMLCGRLASRSCAVTAICRARRLEIRVRAGLDPRVTGRLRPFELPDHGERHADQPLTHRAGDEARAQAPEELFFPLGLVAGDDPQTRALESVE